MNYKEIKTDLINQFNDKNFKELWKEQRVNQELIHVGNNHNLDLTIAFPGYKTEEKFGHIIYDYRVDLKQIPISHTNIVTDIYNKAIQLKENSPELIKQLYKFLIDLSKNALDLNLEDYKELLAYDFKAPSSELLDFIHRSHGVKSYNKNANSWNYSFEELQTIIPYIVLQEDINYPMPRFNGRRMSFYRYVEAVFCAYKIGYSIQHVIKRTLSHERIKPWEQLTSLYEPITNLVS